MDDGMCWIAGRGRAWPFVVPISLGILTHPRQRLWWSRGNRGCLACTSTESCHNGFMDTATIRALSELNNRFYRDNHDSFSKSRHASWPGWERVCASIFEEGTVPLNVPVASRSFHVLDVASGNMRFERFMIDSFPHADFQFTCIDSCEELAQDVEGARFLSCDIIDSLVNDKGFVENLRHAGGVETGFDAAVSFGFMHHIPGRELRESFLRQLVSSVKERGIVALSFWQFMNDSRLAAQARRITGESRMAHAYELEENDYFLGWNGLPDVYRYCHHFTDGEIDLLASSLSDTCEVVDRFNADGRNGAMNAYLVLRR